MLSSLGLMVTLPALTKGNWSTVFVGGVAEYRLGRDRTNAHRLVFSFKPYPVPCSLELVVVLLGCNLCTAASPLVVPRIAPQAALIAVGRHSSVSLTVHRDDLCAIKSRRSSPPPAWSGQACAWKSWDWPTNVHMAKTSPTACYLICHTSYGRAQYPPKAPAFP